MTDRPFAGGVDMAAGPMPGYYPDPSIPGFVRYWGGSAWVPGTSRPAPADGELLEPPRFVARQAVAPPLASRYVPPPEMPAESRSGPGTETGPVFFDQTSAGASFTLAPHAELELRPMAAVTPWQHESEVGRAPQSVPTPLSTPVPEAVPEVAAEALSEVVPQPDSGPAPTAVSTPVAARLPGAQAGWHADPSAQRGLLESDDAPRWVSWGALRPTPVVVPSSFSASTSTPGRASAPTQALGAPTSASAGSPAAAEPDAVPADVEPDAVPADVEPGAVPADAEPDAVPAVAVAPVASAAVRPKPSEVSAPRKVARSRKAARPVAGLGRRFVARLIDSAVLAVVAVAAGSPLLSSALEHLQGKLDQARTASALTHREVHVWLIDPVVAGKAGVLLGVLVLVGFLYEVLPISRTGQTFGKRIARVRVVDVRAGGSRSATPPTLGRSTARWIVGQFSALLLIGLVPPLFDRTARRGWQDRAAGTRVVRA